MNVLKPSIRQSDLPSRVNDASAEQGARGLQRLHVNPQQITPVLTLLRGQDSFESRFKQQTHSRSGSGPKIKAPVDLAADFDSQPATASTSSKPTYQGLFRDGFEPASKPKVAMNPSSFTKPMTADQATVRFMSQLGVSFG